MNYNDYKWYLPYSHSFYTCSSPYCTYAKPQPRAGVGVVSGFMWQRWEAVFIQLVKKTQRQDGYQKWFTLNSLLEIHSPPSYTLLVKVRPHVVRQQLDNVH